MSPDLVPELAESSETATKTSPSPSVDEHLSPEGEEREGVEESDREDRNALADDGWEFFDNREFDMWICYIVDTAGKQKYYE